jgi:hypothetical protein
MASVDNIAILGNILRDPRVKECGALQPFFVEHPSITMKAEVHGRTIVLDIEVPREVSLDLSRGDRLHVFVAVDESVIFLKPGVGTAISVAVPGVSPGVHRIRYGVTYKGYLENGGIACVTVK